MSVPLNNKSEYGDFQTPTILADKIVHILKNDHELNPKSIIEPTCGFGSFIHASYKYFSEASIYGFEINIHYINKLLSELALHQKFDRVIINNSDFFVFNWESFINSINDPILIIGNPPWVTSSDLGSINSKNLPQKSNFQNRRGIEAVTGLSNFDISEWMLLQNIDWLNNREGAIAVLCKYSVARKIFLHTKKSKPDKFSGFIYPIDAKKYFGVSVDACLFLLKKGNDNSDCIIFDNIDSKKVTNIIGERDGFLINDLESYKKHSYLLGSDDNYIWRSGVKHDRTKIMELTIDNNNLINGFGEVVDIENLYTYPLLKSSDLGNSRVKSYRKKVIITQKFVNDETSSIKIKAPKTWDYLMKYRDYFGNRKSSIYNNKPPFSIFGIGEYTFQDWKIAISGFYKELNFHLIGPMSGKPVIFDDTINFLSFDDKSEASFIYKLLTTKDSLSFINSMIFWEDKRPITIEKLKRISIKAIASYHNCLEEYCNWVKIHPNRNR